MVTRSGWALALALILPCLPSCTVTPAADNIAGDWSGSYVDGKSNAQGNVTATFAQQGESLSGTITLPGWACSAASQGNVSGTVSGGEVQISATFGLIAAISLTGNASGSTMTGSYSITSGVCAGDTGSFSLTK